ncbi:MAG: aminotransferase class IV, partial [Phycisphaeraceae bacterium]|nr:aminotransferase class IV [Phycisphaeraceae bacterium]
ITRNVVIELAQQLDIPLHEQAFSSADLPGADEVFITGTGTLLAAVAAVDGNPIGGGRVGPITRQLCDSFVDRVRSDCGVG